MSLRCGADCLTPLKINSALIHREIDKLSDEIDGQEGSVLSIIAHKIFVPHVLLLFLLLYMLLMVLVREIA